MGPSLIVFIVCAAGIAAGLLLDALLMLLRVKLITTRVREGNRPLGIALTAWCAVAPVSLAVHFFL